MAHVSTWAAIFRVRIAAAIILLLAMPFAALAQTGSEPRASDEFRTQRALLEAIEQSLGRPSLNDDALTDLRRRIDPLRTELRARISDLEPRFAEVKGRLDQLGPKPAQGAPAEDEAVARERTDLETQFSDVDGALKTARLLALKGDQLSERITEQRRALFARELFERSASVLDPFFWTDAAAAVPTGLNGTKRLADDVVFYASRNGGLAGALGGVAAALAVFGLGILIRRFWRAPVFDDHRPGTRLAKAHAGLRHLVLNTIEIPVVAGFAFLALDRLNVLPQRVGEVWSSAVLGLLVATLAHASAAAALAPGAPERRLLDVDDAAARRITRLMGLGGIALGLAVAVNGLLKVVFAPVVLTVAASALMALAISAFVVVGLWTMRLRLDHESDPSEMRTQWMRVVGWITITVILGALVAGHIGFAAFIAGRLLLALVAVAIAWLVIVLIDSMIEEATAAGSPRARAVAATLGLAPRSVELVGTLFGAIAKLVIVATALVVAIGPWGFVAADATSAFNDAWFGLRIGEVTISVAAILTALALFLAGLVATRFVQRWLTQRLLPKTALEPSLQNSVATIFGYVGFIVATALALAELGVNPQNIAIVAGALSVGIGFGLQSIVSNFVSGLILLAERPIRVGDTIVVRGEEGYVRRISVRATEIETFERATVLVPNSELITGVVKNWTHSNTTGRIIVKVRVGYASDTDQVRDILMGAACDHPQVLQTPAPRVFLVAFGEQALEFELRCVVANVDYGLTVRSDLHFAILHRFKMAGIDGPWPRKALDEERAELSVQAPVPIGAAMRQKEP